MNRLEVRLGATPADEPGEGEAAGHAYDPEIARAECRLFILAIRAELGREPIGAWLDVVGESVVTEAGRITLYEVACIVDDDSNVFAVAYARRCDDQAPKRWPDGLRAEAAALRPPQG